MATSRANVATPSIEHDRQKERYWDTVIALRSTSKEIRKKGEEFNPRNANEEDRQYDYRRKRTFLDSKYDEAICRLVSKPFKRPARITNEKSLPEELRAMLDDFDGEGTHFSPFMMDVMDVGCDRSATAIFVDHPGDEVESEGQRQAAGIRPYSQHVYPENILELTGQMLPGGQKYWTRLRLRTVSVERDPENEFGQIEVTRIRVYDAPPVPSIVSDLFGDFMRFRAGEISAEDYEARGGIIGSYRVFRVESKDKDPVPENEGKSIRFEYPGIPIHVYSPTNKGLFDSKPLFWNLAEKNAEYYAVRSDYKNILSVAMCPQEVVEGADPSKVTEKSVGPNRVTVVEEGTLRFHEPTCEGLKAGERELERMLDEMRHLAMEPFVQRTGQPTATGRAIDEAKSQTVAQQAVGALSESTIEVLKIAGIWIRKPIPDSVTADIFDQFNPMASPDHLDVIQKDADAGRITVERALEEEQRRGVYDEDMNPKAEAKAAEKERAAMMPTADQFGEDEGGEDDDE